MRRSVLGGLALAVVLTVSGCGGSDSADPDPSAASTPPTTAPPTSAAPTTEPTTSTDVAPAAGPEISSVFSALNAPAGWYDEPSASESGGNTYGPDGDLSYNVELNDTIARAPKTTDQLVQDAKKFGSFKNLEVLPEVTIAGNAAYHVSGLDENFGLFVDEFGFTSDRKILIRISTPPEASQAERDAIIGPVLASFHFLG